MEASAQFGRNAWRLAYGVALKILKTPDQAEDAAQEAMLRAYRARESFSGAARFESWIYRIAFTTALGYLRKPYYRHHKLSGSAGPDRTADDELATVEAPGPSPEEEASGTQLAECLQGCLETMRELDRVAFTERFLNGTSEHKLGKLLGVSTNAAKQRAFRARLAVRDCVRQKQGSGGDTGAELPGRRTIEPERRPVCPTQ